MRPASKAEGKTGGVDPLLLQEKAHSLGQSPLSVGYRPFKASIFEARFGSIARIPDIVVEWPLLCIASERLGFDPRHSARRAPLYSSHGR